MSPRGAAAFCRSAVLLLLTLCFAWRFSTAAVSAGPGPEVSGSPDLLRVLEERKRVGHRARRLARVLPRDQDARADTASGER